MPPRSDRRAGTPDPTQKHETASAQPPNGRLEAELIAFEAAERERLGLPPAMAPQWTETVHDRFTRDQRERTTILVSGLTDAHEVFLVAALKSLGYRARRLDCPDTGALWVGKEFGSRGMCNPSYFTVGNLLKFLRHLHEEEGLSKPEIIERYLMLTVNGCGPCRFGMYLTEYRKALRDSGFEGFRVLLLGQTLANQELGEGGGLEINTRVIIATLKAMMLGDIINLLAYRIRPYETVPGATDAAMESCKTRIANALERRAWLLPLLWRCRRELARIPVVRTRVKPRVSLIGEFWAMTTEGDGNYRMQRFLESEGAEVEIQTLTAWVLLMIWEVRHDMRLRRSLPGRDTSGGGIAGVNVSKRMRITWLLERAMRIAFAFFAHSLGLRGYTLPDMDAYAKSAEPFLDTFNRGGEMYMEVADLLHNAAHNTVNLTVSVKPFGCMPSSSISDGVQSYITEQFPNALFLPIETTGDGAVNVYSRLQMQLFKARRLARGEADSALARHRMSEEEARSWLMARPRFNHALYHPRQRHGSTAADIFEAIGRRKWVGLWRFTAPLTSAGGLLAVGRRWLSKAPGSNKCPDDKTEPRS